MTRRARRLVLAVRMACVVALAVLITFAVSVLCSLRDPATFSWTSEMVNGQPVLRGWLWASPQTQELRRPTSYTYVDELGYSIDVVTHYTPLAPLLPANVPGGVRGYSQTRYRAGFPARAFEARNDVQGPLPGATVKLGRFTYRGMWQGLTYQLPGSIIVANVPVRPWWPGFLFNVFFYGAVIMAVTAPFIGARARRRGRLGQCTACGYRLEGLARCPECGAEALPGTDGGLQPTAATGASAGSPGHNSPTVT
ncbi:MAG TPA: hypothetical protein VD997_04170 [Phycisphaerales bacterium]|nr:hypothetical protein [Phycisphaerales bacterium]